MTYREAVTYITRFPSRRRKLHTLAAMTFADALALSACATGNSSQDPDGTGPEPPPPETGTVTAAENSGNIDTADLGGEVATSPSGEPDRGTAHVRGHPLSPPASCPHSMP